MTTLVYVFFDYFFKKPKRTEKKKFHVKCRNSDPNNDKFYYQSNVDGVKGKSVTRMYIPDDAVSWSVYWSGYKPINFTTAKIKSKPVYADDEDTAWIRWNQIDGKLDRTSHTGKYEIDSNNRPLNPNGRTGISGRGQLGRWGPNHAADPICTRWKRGDNGIISNELSGRPILEFVSIQRKDVKEWAIPGGMVDCGEKVSATVKREFMEEAMNGLEKSDEEKQKVVKQLESLFNQEVVIYKGYVDDPRNTDNAWMETVAFNFHDENNEVLNEIKLEAGDDAGKVQWISIDKNLKLYASHKDFIEKVAKLHNAHW